VNPNVESTEPFIVMIYPNPSFIGKVKMSWMDNQNVGSIILVLDNFDNVVEINLKVAKEVTVDNLKNGQY